MPIVARLTAPMPISHPELMPLARQNCFKAAMISSPVSSLTTNWLPNCFDCIRASLYLGCGSIAGRTRYYSFPGKLVQGSYSASWVLDDTNPPLPGHAARPVDHLASQGEALRDALVNISDRDIYQPQWRQGSIDAARTAYAGCSFAACRHGHVKIAVLAHLHRFGLPADDLGVEVPDPGGVLHGEVCPGDRTDFLGVWVAHRNLHKMLFIISCQNRVSCPMEELKRGEKIPEFPQFLDYNSDN